MAKVFISSTVEDLRQYREKARDAALSAGLHPVMQEYFAAQGEHPPLDACLQTVYECDVLVVIAAQRHGWTPSDQPLVDGKKGVKSITRLECEQAIENGKEVLAFLIEPKHPWPIDLKEEGRLAIAAQEGKLTQDLVTEVQRNMVLLKEFKDFLSSRSIRNEFTTPDNLSSRLINTLRDWKERHRIDENGPIITSNSKNPHRYLEWLNKECGSVDIRGLQVSGNKAYRFDIEELYTPLYTVGGEIEKDDKKQAGLDRRRRKVSLDEVVKSKHTVIIGDPGSGKSTFLRHVSAILCRSLLGEKPAAVREKLGMDAASLPLFIRIGELATHIIKCDERKCADTPTSNNTAEWLIHYLASKSQTENWDLSAAFFREQCTTGKAMLLIDGLDEAPGRIARERISAIIELAVRAYDKCTVIVSSRPGGYEGRAVLDSFTHCMIAPLEENEIRFFLSRWSGALYQGDERKAGEYSEELVRAVTAKPEIRRMAINPVMLTALAVLYWNDKRLPDQRAELYESIITWLLRSRQDKPNRILNEDLSRRAHQRLAFVMQSFPEGRLKSIDKALACDAVLPLMPGDTDRDKLENARRFIEDEELDSGIIVSRGTTVEFWHLTFQEYLAARELSGMSEKEQDEAIFKNPDKTVHNPDWRETLLLLVGVMYKQGVGKVNAFFSTILNKAEYAAKISNEEKRLAVQARCFGLMGSMVSDLSAYNYMVPDKKYLTLRDDVMGIFNSVRAAKIDAIVRCAAGDALGQAGDPRIVEDLRDPKARKMFVEIKAGGFLMGAQRLYRNQKNFDEEAYPDESPVHRVELSSYWISKFPVTVSQFRRFVEDDGYNKSEYWNAGGFGKMHVPENWEDQLHFPNRPVVEVSWFDAMAFCSWASLSLPTEAQWERAARGLGEEYRKYPWGNNNPDVQRANFSDTKIGHASPVGVFPAGNVAWDKDTDLWLSDMAGNVWEWCLDWKEGEYDEESIFYRKTEGVKDPFNDKVCGQEAHVLRGGSWSNLYPQYLRCALREWNGPYFSNDTLGFRCVSSR